MNNNQNNIQPTTPKTRIDNFTFGLSFFNATISTNNLDDYLKKLEVYLIQKYPFLSSEQVTIIAQGVKLIMLNNPQTNPIEEQEGLKAGISYR